MKITTDAGLNPKLANEVQGLRGMMLGAATKNPLPDRFVVEPHASRPAMIITDTVTGKTSTVPLFAYGEVRATLTDLFGE